MNNLSTDNIIARAPDGTNIVMVDGFPTLYKEIKRGLLTIYRPTTQDYRNERGHMVALRGHWRNHFNDRHIVERQLIDAFEYLCSMGQEITLYTTGKPKDLNYPNTVEFQRGLPVYVTDLYYGEGGLMIKGEVIITTDQGYKVVHWDFDLTDLQLNP